MGALTLGLDVGQKRDPSAVAVVETEWRSLADGRQEPHQLVRFLQRLPLGTPYPAVSARAAEIAQHAGERAASRPTLYVDATGVGSPLVDLLRQAQVPADLVAVYFTHGDRRSEVRDPAGTLTEIRLGKAWLVSRLQALLQSSQLHLPQTDEAQALARELLDYEIRVSEDANDRYGAFKVGTHDDLVTALGLAVQAEAAAPFDLAVAEELYRELLRPSPYGSMAADYRWGSAWER